MNKRGLKPRKLRHKIKAEDSNEDSDDDYSEDNDEEDEFCEDIMSGDEAMAPEEDEGVTED